ncbi:MAG TPA: sigma-54 dependent transcriptional regulator [Planctomycetota bacterium]|nr:sigma-54 dependent transcriptional regulator [Planctomycetota bacterium]
MDKLLVIDDEPGILYSIGQCFEGDGIEVLTASNADDGLRLAGEQSPNVILLDIRLGAHSGLDVFTALRKLNPRLLVVFITGHGSAEIAIEAMERGAFDYLVKPLDLPQLRQTVTKALSISRLMRTPAIVEEFGESKIRADRLVGSGPLMQAVCKQIGRVAQQEVNVLILGESGTGKELVARAIYQHSLRKNAQLMAINCAAIPETLLESELFGHERGAFTGADRRRIGKFEQCNGGTILLDEIGDMAPGTQAKILRLLQERRVERIGGNETIPIDVRIIAATNQNLDALMQQGRFRADLYYRLCGVTIHLPPLRQRREDIAELAHYFLFRFNRQFETFVQSIDPDALALLERYDWPGNVRQLQSVIREAQIVSAGPSLLPDFLPESIRHFHGGASQVAHTPIEEPTWQNLFDFVEKCIANGQSDVYRRALEKFDRLLLARALRQCEGQQNRAAELLGLSRVTLRAKLRALNMHVTKTLMPGEGGEMG